MRKLDASDGTDLTWSWADAYQVRASLAPKDELRALVRDFVKRSIAPSPQRLERTPISAGEIASVVGERVRAEVERKHLELVLLIDEGAYAPALGHPTQLRRALFNLVSNAVQFTDEGRITISVHRDHGMLVYEVRDSAPDDAGSARFPHDSSTWRRASRGLEASKQLVAAMGGTLVIESEHGAGSCFSFELRAGL